MDIDAIRRQAAARVQARRTPTVTRSRTLNFAGGETVEFTAEVPAAVEAYAAPETLADWLDDALALHGFGWYLGPHSEPLVAALEAGRTDRARAAQVLVAGARKLGQWEHHRLHVLLGQLHSRADGARIPAAAALLRELDEACERMRGAVTERPEEPEYELPDPPAADRYAKPVPAGASAPWMWGGAA